MHHWLWLFGKPCVALSCGLVRVTTLDLLKGFHNESASTVVVGPSGAFSDHLLVFKT